MFKRKPKPIQPFTWERHRRRWIYRFLFLGVPTAVWMLFGKLGLLSEPLFGTGVMVLSVLTFLAGMPTSLVIRLDRINEQHTYSSPTLLLIGLGVLLVNFVVVGGLLGWVQARRAGTGDEGASGKRADPSGQVKPKLNGSQLH
ncbi:MAG: hypothetical protein U0136_18180 [Bdellovibrionota bacterium]